MFKYRWSLLIAVALWSATTLARGAGPTPATQAARYPAHGAACTSFARAWTSAFLTGNGTMGALVMGADISAAPPRPQEDTLYFSHNRLFLPVGAPRVVPDLAANLPDLRQTIRTRGYGPALMSAYATARQQNFPGLTHNDPFLPALSLKLKMPGGDASRDYLRTENFQTGEVSIYWSDEAGAFVRNLFISRADNVAVLWIGPAPGQAEAPAISCELSVPPIPNVPVRMFQQNNPAAAPADGAASALIQTTIESDTAGMALHALYREAPGTGYDAAVRIVADRGTVDISEGVVSVKNARNVLLLLRIEPFRQPAPNSERMLRRSLEPLPATYEELLARHVAIHRALFDRIALDLAAGDDRASTTDELLVRAARDNKMPAALLEKLYEGSRYAILCAAGDRPPNAQGIWSGTFSPVSNFSADYAFDNGFHQALASVLSCNTPELLRGAFSLAEDSRAEWQMNAKYLFGARGIVVPPHQTSSGRSGQWSDRFPGGLCWISGAGAIAHWYYDDYLFTGDKKFLAEKAVPYMKLVAAFYEDFLHVDDTGRYRFSPSFSAEDAPGDNATQEIMVARELLTNLIAACRELKIEQAGIRRWQAMLEKMPDYLIAPNGELQEWALPGVMNKSNQRHIPHLYAIYQSAEFDPEKTPELWKASRAAYQARLTQWFRPPTKANDMNPQSLNDRVQMALCAARFGEADTVWEILSRVAAKCTYPSMITQRFEDGKTFAVDAGGTVPAILNNALVYSQLGRIDLLPALPRELPSGEIRGMAARGQILIDRLHWAPRTVDIELTSAKDQSIDLRLSGKPVRTLALNANQKTRLTLLRP